MQLKRLNVMMLMAMATMWALGGCRAQVATTEPTTPADEMSLTRIREAFKRIDPQSQVGPVIAIVPEDRLVAIGDVTVRDFIVGETIIFIDADSNPLVSGTVNNVLGDTVHVRYDPPTADRRAPRVGDLAVKVK
jgi:hypothetical protein